MQTCVPTINRAKRPNEAVLPHARRPQVANIGERKRVIHLSKKSRVPVPENGGPPGLPNDAKDNRLRHLPGRSLKGHSYRNAVFQALLNLHMLVNFARMHYRHYRVSKSCAAGLNCLTCKFAELASAYWFPEHTDDCDSKLNEACRDLWTVCQNAFWPRVSTGTRIGPVDIDEEFYPDTFLLHFLTEMQRQLESSPGQYQTFEEMFTIHMVRKVKCVNRPRCSWVSTPTRWESAIHLNLAVQKPSGKITKTSVEVGIRRALSAAGCLTSRRGSIASIQRCELCRGNVTSHIEITNLPEILIVVRNLDELEPTDRIDIPFDQELDTKALLLEENEARTKDYELVSGIGEARVNPLVSRSYAFARGPEAMNEKWFCMLDNKVSEIGFDDLEMLQRMLPREGYEYLLPEVFIYRRRDYEKQHRDIEQYGVESPDGEFAIARNAVSRSANDIFVQKIGRGLLKFKVKLAPADPTDTDIVEVDLNLSYELNGKHYGIMQNDDRNFVGLHLMPLLKYGQGGLRDQPSPYEGNAVHRTVQRWKGVYPATKIEAQQEIIEKATAEGLPIPDGKEAASGPASQPEPMDVDQEADGIKLDHRLKDIWFDMTPAEQTHFVAEMKKQGHWRVRQEDDKNNDRSGNKDKKYQNQKHSQNSQNRGRGKRGWQLGQREGYTKSNRRGGTKNYGINRQRWTS